MQRTTRTLLSLFTLSIVIVLLACGGCSQPTPTQSELTQPPPQTSAHSAGVVSTPMEAALDALRARFPNQLVVGFEELWEARPDAEPQVDLGPRDASLESTLERVRSLNRTYKVELLQHRLVHVYPAHATADPAHLLDIRLKVFRMPPDHCLQKALDDMAYAPELSKFLFKKHREWYHKQGKEPPVEGVIAGQPGGCSPFPSPHPEEGFVPTVYRNVTVRHAMNLMALRSLQLSLKEVQSTDRPYALFKPISWKFRFRPEPEADTGLGGVPVFQTF